MKKFFRFFRKSLYIELTWAVLLSFIVGTFCYFTLIFFSDTIANSKWASEKYAPRKVSTLIDGLQTYIYTNEISSKDSAKLTDWYARHQSAFFYIRKDDYIVYNTFITPKNDGTTDPIPASDEDFKDLADEYQSFYDVTKAPIKLADGNAVLVLCTDVQYNLFLKLQRIDIACSALLIIFVLIHFVRRKIHYIKDVTTGINILEGGDLDYQIPVRGHDEISQMAVSLNSMRVSLAQQMKNEKQALQANNSLVTALSHDLRTPLTTQMGYLEILKGRHYSSPEEMEKYVDTALKTCYQIKEMSDRLFEYFLAFDPHPERPAEALEEFDGVDLFMQLIGELSLPLESQGFSFEIEDPMETFLINVNMSDMLRVFNNVFTNIDKYADESEPVKVRVFHDDKHAVLEFSNKIRQVPRKNESAKIGLISISSLMKRQGGDSRARTARDHFIIELKFPIH
ncbi:Signal transduction histidine kinase [Pseudobutyrivibrio sp. YE44]|uniref:HAMP domain-containing sensor histidine kinase n=1 Tax=Pseudobutyrivibrio sp. YE44 TaxID=1520802 RepID=UPI00088A297F|nr:HAMP domain-containing sensor histidine kinase [Pseudobutyrivibrio sp. YE44]SDB29311.1 Signal transduction histidine kinase [Pseudobutyrivibrio sp. YE44]